MMINQQTNDIRGILIFMFIIAFISPPSSRTSYRAVSYAKDVDDPTGLAPVVKKAGCCGATPLFQRLPPPAQGRWATEAHRIADTPSRRCPDTPFTKLHGQPTIKPNGVGVPSALILATRYFAVCDRMPRDSSSFVNKYPTWILPYTQVRASLILVWLTNRYADGHQDTVPWAIVYIGSFHCHRSVGVVPNAQSIRNAITIQHFAAHAFGKLNPAFPVFYGTSIPEVALEGNLVAILISRFDILHG
jgi:hypothetical protein